MIVWVLVPIPLSHRGRPSFCFARLGPVLKGMEVGFQEDNQGYINSFGQRFCSSRPTLLLELPELFRVEICSSWVAQGHPGLHIPASLTLGGTAS